MALQLDGPQSGELFNALMNAFSNPGQFERMIAFKLNLNLFDFVPINPDRPTMIYETIKRINADWRADELIAGAREANPTNVILHEFSQQFGLTSVGREIARQEFERIVNETGNFLNPASFREKLADVEPKVCRIMIRTNEGMINGTGFLVAPDIVMTNYHVVEAVILGEKGEATADGVSAKAADVKCVFDYKRSPDNKTLNPGVPYRLAAAWLVGSSPASPLDEIPPKDHLDYALLRLNGKAGNDPVGGMTPAAGGVARRWITLPETPYDFPADSPVFIMQHPKGSPLKLAFASNGVIGVNENQTRVRHRVNTEGGSSGSPCFSQNWELIALHHSGDPDFDPAHKPTYNEAIPIGAIVDLMRENGIELEGGV